MDHQYLFVGGRIIDFDEEIARVIEVNLAVAQQAHGYVVGSGSNDFTFFFKTGNPEII